RIAPSRGSPVCTLTVTANAAASARMAPAMYARITVSRVDMKIFASPASIILVASSEGLTYDTESLLRAGVGTGADRLRRPGTGPAQSAGRCFPPGCDEARPS